MKLLIQRVSSANVKVETKVVGSINRGFLIFIAIEEFDVVKDIDYLVNKVLRVRVFEDVKGKLNNSIKDIKGELLIVSQFTLCASFKKGTRPSFSSAKSPDIAKDFYFSFIQKMKEVSNLKVESGVFGAKMKVELVNDGPFTFLIENQTIN